LLQVSCALRGFHKLALHLLEEMQTLKVPADRILYGLVMQACSQAK
jgi:hypothetical protein